MLYALTINTALSGDVIHLRIWAERVCRREIFGEQQPQLLDLVVDAWERKDYSELEQ